MPQHAVIVAVVSGVAVLVVSAVPQWPRQRSHPWRCRSHGRVHRTGGVRRRPEDERWSRELTDQVAGEPKEITKRPNTLAKKDEEGHPPRAPPIYARVEPPEPQVRAFRITRKDCIDYGSTPGCAGWRALQNNTESRNHSQTCRDRYEALLRNTEAGQERADRANKRMDDAVARAGEKILDKKRRTEREDCTEPPA